MNNIFFIREEARAAALRVILSGASLLTLAACTGDELAERGTELPAGKYPITFTAAVDGLTVTRATADGSWTGTEEVAIQIGSTTKKYTVSSGGSMSVAAGDTPFYWENKDDIAVSAWYPYNSGSKPALVVKADQSKDNGYQLSDYLEATDATVTFQEPKLTFTHRTAKVVATLEAGDGITDLTGATLTFVNQRGVEGGGTEVTPKTETNGDNVTTHTALLIPQQIQNNQFIKVTIGSNAYYYTPTNATDVDLKAGMAYTYTITVKKEGLQVTVGTSASWDDNEENGNATNATFKVHLADYSSSVPANTSNYTVKDADGNAMTASDGVYSTTGNEISISLSANENYRLKKFLTKVNAGICKQKESYTAASRTYTYTFYDIRSDLWLDGIQAEAEAVSTSLSNPSVGDYYYADGTWSSTLEKPCIGIVFKVGGGTDDQASNYSNLESNTIHGYVVALNDAHSDVGAWGIRLVDVDGLDNNNSASNKYDGYKNTTVVRNLEAYTNTDISQPMKNGQYWAFKVASLYAVTAPGNTSGWYLPSIQQLADIYALSGLATCLSTVGGTDFKRTENNGRYWSATEKNEYDSWYYQFKENGGSGCNAKSNDGGNYLNSSKSYVRAILTF
ncbi:fimbrillin family protein [Parabacteroides sp.]